MSKQGKCKRCIFPCQMQTPYWWSRNKVAVGEPVDTISIFEYEWKDTGKSTCPHEQLCISKGNMTIWKQLVSTHPPQLFLLTSALSLSLSLSLNCSIVHATARWVIASPIFDTLKAKQDAYIWLPHQQFIFSICHKHNLQSKESRFSQCTSCKATQGITKHKLTDHSGERKRKLVYHLCRSKLKIMWGAEKNHMRN